MATTKGGQPVNDTKEDDRVSRIEYLDLEKNVDVAGRSTVPELDEDEEKGHNKPVETARDLVTSILRTEDDPTLNPWTFRTWFLGPAQYSFKSDLLI